MSQHFVTNNLVGFEHNVSTGDFMELVAWDECFDNRNGKVRKTSTKELAAGEKKARILFIGRGFGEQNSKHKSLRLPSQVIEKRK